MGERAWRAQTIPLLALSLFLLGCGSTGPGVRAHADQRYTVTASLLSVRGGPVTAARMVCASMPPACATGVVVRGVDIHALPGAHDYGNGTVESPRVRLVGTWDGQALTVTERPVPASVPPSVTTRVPPRGDGSSPFPQPPDPRLDAERRLAADDQKLRSRGIYVVEQGFDGYGMYVIVAVAGPATVTYLQRNYVPDLRVEGWLQPV
jgi:hypothetical protein